MNKPALPVILAPTMIAAQGWSPSAAERAAITAHGDYFRNLTGDNDKFLVSVSVLDNRTNVEIGSIDFQA